MYLVDIQSPREDCSAQHRWISRQRFAPQIWKELWNHCDCPIYCMFDHHAYNVDTLRAICGDNTYIACMPHNVDYLRQTVEKYMNMSEIIDAMEIRCTELTVENIQPLLDSAITVENIQTILDSAILL